MRTSTPINNKTIRVHHEGTNKIGKPFFLLFALSMFLFMMQAWSPEIYLIPVQILLIWFLFANFFLLYGSLFKNSLAIFSPVQWGAISILGISIFLRSSLDSWDMLRFGQFITGIMIALLGSQIFQNDRGRKVLLSVLALGAVTSSIFAIFQYFNFAPWLWQVSKYTGIGYIRGSTGLENNPVSFANSIIGISTLLTGSWLIQWRYRTSIVAFPSGIIATFCFISITGLVVSNSRSGLLGLILGITIVLFFSGRAINTSWPLAPNKSHIQYISEKRRNASWLFLTGYIILLAIMGLLAYAITVQNTNVLQDVRLGANWQFYFSVIWVNPIGFPGGADMIQAFEQLGTHEYISLIQNIRGELLAPHNLFLTTGISYGPMAMLALFTLYVTALLDGKRAFSSLQHEGDSKAALWILLLAAVNITIITHSWFHNASIAMGEMRNWLWLGLLLVVVRNPSYIQE